MKTREIRERRGAGRRAAVCLMAVLCSFSCLSAQESSSRVSRVVAEGRAKYQEKRKKIDQDLSQSEKDAGKRLESMLREGMTAAGKAGRLDNARSYYRVKSLHEQGNLEAEPCRRLLGEAAASAVMEQAEKLKSSDSELRRRLSELNRETYQYADSFVKKARLLKGGKELRPAEFAELIEFRDQYDLPPGAEMPGKGLKTGGLKCTLYEGDFSRVDDIAARGRRLSVSRIPSVGLPWGVPEDEYGLILEGSYYAEEAGEAEFSLSSDDGSRLSVAGRVVISNDGCHGVREVKGKVSLRQGWNPIKVEYFDQRLDEALSLKVKNKSGEFVEIPSRFFASEWSVESVKEETSEL